MKLLCSDSLAFFLVQLAFIVSNPNISQNSDEPRNVVTPTGLIYTILERGSGPAAQKGDHVHIHEIVSIQGGPVYLDTRDGGEPVRFLLGGQQAIEGVDEGVTGMKVGERRRLIIPPKLSKRSAYPKGLPPDATLVYEVVLIAIEPSPD